MDFFILSADLREKADLKQKALRAFKLSSAFGFSFD